MNIPTAEVLSAHVSRALVALTGTKPAHVRVSLHTPAPGVEVHVTYAPGDHDSVAVDPIDLEALDFIQNNACALSPWAVEMIADRVVLSLIWHTTGERRKRAANNPA